jgi:hypothetical protein
MKGPFKPREGDLPRKELAALAEHQVGPQGQWPGAEVIFKFTCKHCGERCCLEEPNKLYEYGECCACGRSTKIEFGGFMVHFTVDRKKGQK